jgi:hypothetical protein
MFPATAKDIRMAAKCDRLGEKRDRLAQAGIHLVWQYFLALLLPA